MTDLKNKVGLITGGSKGIGLGVAEAFARRGLKVAITGRNPESVQKAASELSQKTGSEVLGIQADVRDFQSQQNVVNQILEKWGQLDVVIANAGVGKFGAVDELSVEDWQQTIDTNLTGVFYTLKASVDALKESKGYLITISSLAGTNFFEGGAAYNASKFGVTGFTQAAMLDLRQYGIKVTTIMPGSVSTYFNSHIPSEEDNWKIQPEDIAKIVLGLLEMHPRVLPSKVEVRPTRPSKK